VRGRVPDKADRLQLLRRDSGKDVGRNARQALAVSGACGNIVHGF
jgi:hypothetical protein